MAEKTNLRLALKLFCGLALIIAASLGVDWLLRIQNYPVRSVRFEGAFQHVTRAELEAAVMPLVRGNFFLVDLERIKQRVESIPWVHRASVRRSFPSDVYVQFTEQQLFARWREAEWVNTSGEVVRVPGEGSIATAARFTGPDGTAARVLAAYRELTEVLAPQGLRIAALQVTARHGWRVEIQREPALGGKSFVLILDNDDPRKRVERFARVYAASLMSDTPLLKQVDLRYTNGFSIEWRSARDGSRAAPVAGATFTAGRGEG